MKTGVIVGITLLTATNLIGQTNHIVTDDSNSLPVVLTTTSGKTFNSAKLLRVEPDGLSIEYAPEPRATGIAKVKFEHLSAELQQQFGYDAQKAVAFEAQQARGTAEIVARMWADSKVASSAAKKNREENERELARREKERVRQERERIRKEREEEERKREEETARQIAHSDDLLLDAGRYDVVYDDQSRPLQYQPPGPDGMYRPPIAPVEPLTPATARR